MANVLLLASNRERANDMRSLLRLDGHEVAIERSLDRWLDVERSVRPELVVANVESMATTLQQAAQPARGFPAPLLFIHGEDGFFNEVHLDERLIDRIASPFTDVELLARVDALIRVKQVIQGDPAVRRAWRGQNETPEQEPEKSDNFLGRLGGFLGRRIPRATLPLGPYLEVAARVADWADRRDAFEPGHAERVTTFCAMIAEGLGLGSHETTCLLRAAMLHDIGKVAMPLEILHKEGPLQEGQMRLMRTHTRRGAAILNALDPDPEVTDTILYHHERPDGSGYYERSAEEVPRAAKILAVAEVFDAMTSSRVTRTVPVQEALGMLESSRGIRLDSDCVDALVDKLRPRPLCIPLTPMI